MSKQIELLRRLVRKELAEVLREEPLEPEQEKTTAPEQPGLDPALVEFTSRYIRRIRQTVGTPDSDDLSEMLALVLNTLIDSSEEKLSILKQTRNKTVR